MEGQDGLERELAGRAPGFVHNILTTMGQDKGMAYLRTLAKQQVVNVDARRAPCSIR